MAKKFQKNLEFDVAAFLPFRPENCRFKSAISARSLFFAHPVKDVSSGFKKVFLDERLKEREKGSKQESKHLQVNFIVTLFRSYQQWPDIAIRAILDRHLCTILEVIYAQYWTAPYFTSSYVQYWTVASLAASGGLASLNIGHFRTKKVK